MKTSKRSQIRNWHSANLTGTSDYLYIPEGHSNAFKGVVAFEQNPSVAVLDFNICLQNLQNKGIEYDDAFAYLLTRTKKRAEHEPILVFSYPELHPNYEESK